MSELAGVPDPSGLTRTAGLASVAGTGEATVTSLLGRLPAASPTTSSETSGHVESSESEPFAVWSRRYTAALLAADAVLGAASVWLALWLMRAGKLPGTSGLTGPSGATSSPAGGVVWLVVVGALAWPAVIASARGYVRRSAGTGVGGGNEVRSVVRAVIGAVALTAVPAVVFDLQAWLALVVYAVLVAAPGGLVVRLTARAALHHSQRHGRSLRKVAVVGSAQSAAELITLLDQEPNTGVEVVGAYVPDEDRAAAAALDLDVLGDLADVADAAGTDSCDAVAVAPGADTGPRYVRELAWSLEGEDVELLVHPGVSEVATSRVHVESSDSLPLLQIDQPHFTGWRRVLKRFGDLFFGSVVLLLSTPLLLAIAAVIKIDDGGPVIFRQTRAGRDGRSFTMIKFRSMQPDAERRRADLSAVDEGAGPMFKIADDPRVTRVGRLLRRYSLDELPQLINVLSGSMSLVGPRPPLPTEQQAYDGDSRRRLLVSPGMTGLWQVSGRSLLSWEESVRLDLRYVENWTPVFDLRIILRTVSAVLRPHGAF